LSNEIFRIGSFLTALFKKIERQCSYVTHVTRDNATNVIKSNWRLITHARLLSAAHLGLPTFAWSFRDHPFSWLVWVVSFLKFSTFMQERNESPPPPCTRYSEWTIISLSHARTVVRECCKGDDRSQRERGKFDPHHPKNPQPMVTKICVGDYVVDIYQHAKFYPNRFRGFGPAHAWVRAPRHKVTRLCFVGGGVLDKGYWVIAHVEWNCWTACWRNV